MNKTILVSGGAGFIGNCFCKLLLKERKGWRVVNVDVCTYAAKISGLISLIRPSLFVLEFSPSSKNEATQ